MAAIEDTRARTAPTHAVIAQRYELGQPLARGGMATLWRAWDRRLCRPVAVKTLRDDDLTDSVAYTRLRREALVSAALSHTNIVEIHDFVEEDGRPFLIMELVEGDDLKRRIYQRGPLDPFDALQIARQICLALQVTHQRGVIHRDVKPHNILLTRSGHAKLTDFGLALSPLDTIPDDSGFVFGTPEYMAPEQAMGERISAATDVYGLGITLYESLVGDAPFQTPSAEETMKQHISMPVTPLRSLRSDVSPGIEEVVMRALEKEPERRYASARQLAEALDAAASEARSRRTVFGAPTWEPSPEPPALIGLNAAIPARAITSREWASALPDAVWVRLMWVVFALNIMLALTLLCVFVLHMVM